MTERGPRKGKFKPPSIASQVATKLVRGDIRGAIRILSSSAKVLPLDANTRRELQDKHPPAHPNSILPEPPEADINCLMATREEVKNAIKSFRNGSGGGPDCLLPQHLKDMIEDSLGGAAIQLLDALMDFCSNIVLRGKVPRVVCPLFFGATLIALSKDDGGQ